MFALRDVEKAGLNPQERREDLNVEVRSAREPRAEKVEINLQQGRTLSRLGQAESTYRHARYHGLCPLFSKFRPVVLQLVNALLWRIGVQLEGMPPHFHLSSPLTTQTQMKTSNENFLRALLLTDWSPFTRHAISLRKLMRSPNKFLRMQRAEGKNSTM